MLDPADSQAQTDETPLPAETESAEAVAAPREPWGIRHRRMIEVCSLLVTVAFLAGAGVGMVAGYRPLLSRAGELSSQPVKVNVEWPPLAGLVSSAPALAGGEPRTWANADIRTSIEQLAIRQLSADPFDTASMVRAREALMATGWFMDDLRLLRAGDGVVNITGAWRAPVAAVRSSGEDHLVAAGGELLPVTYAQDTSGMKLVLNAAHPMPAPGAPWVGGEVQEALKLLAYLRGMPGYEQVAGVDVSQFEPGRTLVIITDKSNKIIWGGPPDEMHPGQVAAASKAQRLVQLLKAYGRIDAGHAVVDVRTEPVPVLVDANAAQAMAIEMKSARHSGATEPAPAPTPPAASGSQRPRSHR